MVNNPYFYSTLGTAPSTQIADSSDNPHSGLIKALSIGMTGSYAIKAGNDFAITIASASTVTVAAGKILRDGLKVDISGSGTLTLGSVDSAGTTKTNTLYSLIVVAANNSLAIRTTTTEEAVPAYTLGDIPVALLLYTGDTNMEIQFLTTNKTDNSITLAHESSSDFTPTATITSASGGTTITNTIGDLIIDNQDTNDQIILQLGTDSAATAVQVKNNNGDILWSVTGVGTETNNGLVYYTERASAGSDGAGFGQVWVKSDAPNNLYFTDDTGQDVALTDDGKPTLPSGDISVSGTLEIQDGLTTTGAVLTLSTKEPSVVANDVLGRINFQAPLDTGLDSDLVSASIHAEAQTTFSDTVNQTSIVFSTGASETATEKVRITSGGKLGIGVSTVEAPLHVKHDGANATMILESTEAGATGAPDLVLRRSSSTPANDDVIGNISFNGIDDADDEETFVSIVGQMADVANASIDGRLKIYIKEGGSSSAHVIEIAEGTFAIRERDAVGGLDTNVGMGRIWIKNDNPNNLYFTNDASNDIQLTNGATGPLLTGKHSIWVPASAMYPSTTNGCSALTQVETTALRPDLKVLDFATGADEFAQFTVSFPKSWNEGTVTFQPFWTVTGTNTGTVKWELAGISVANDASINTAFGTQVGPAALAHSGTSNDQMVSAESGAVTITGAAVDTVTYFQINRDVSDTQSGDARLLGVKVFYNINAGNDE